MESIMHLEGDFSDAEYNKINDVRKELNLSWSELVKKVGVMKELCR
ncbi:MAG: hypothetical protein PHY47_21810 [Lachnospiraceae bacterium]|nr:hypothetical protein [Lachnospiraceae bacterium]MDD4249023.1 hypothetical protein [Methanosarcina sp.]